MTSNSQAALHKFTRNEQMRHRQCQADMDTGPDHI